jgi:hypothetical protein
MEGQYLDPPRPPAPSSRAGREPGRSVSLDPDSGEPLPPAGMPPQNWKRPGADDPNFVVRPQLIMRIMQGRICGHTLPSGRPCLGVPLRPGWGCRLHVKPESRSVYYRAEKGLAELLGRVIQGRERETFGKFVEQSHVLSLEDQLALCRLRIAGLESDYQNGLIPLSSYETRLFNYWKALRGLSEAHAKLLETAANPNLPSTTEPEPDGFDPVAEILRAKPEPGADNG